MFRLVVLFAFLTLCRAHAILPIVPVPAVHTSPLVVPYSLQHGYAAGSGLYGHGLYGHGLLAKPLVHHLLKRSPHLVAPLAHAVAPVAVAPVAVSHQSRVDVHSSPVVGPIIPIVKPLVTPFVAAPYLQKALVPTPYYGLGHYGGHYGGHY